MSTPLRPRLALPFTILGGTDRVRLVAGEDFRYTLAGPGLDGWLSGWLPLLDGRWTVAELLAALPDPHRFAARQVLERLAGERVIIEGPAADAHPGRRFRPLVEGTGSLREGWEAAADGAESLAILCQDRLDFDTALRFNRCCLEGDRPWLWTSSGPMTRGYVSPAFLPDAGPCLECLLRQFRRLSPVPELYDELVEHATNGRPIEPVPFPDRAVAVLRQVLLWKIESLGHLDPPAALYHLHVVEAATLEVSTHRVFADPECPACARRR
jgi:bacteriocin biosynthesis cyclodehydratase domain-containing protein